MAWTTDWTTRGACRASDPDALFVQGAEQNRAKQVCRGCTVRTECLADALDNRVEFGVWGGMTERERRALLRRRPNVTSWRRLLAAAQAEWEKSGQAEWAKPNAEWAKSNAAERPLRAAG
jgi:WhiB family redox-sensing transcriptional regulator